MPTKQYNDWATDMANAKPYTLKTMHFLSSSFDAMQNIEDSDNMVLKWMDQCAGIDVVGLKNGHVSGIAMRVQPISKDKNPWNTFTIRYERRTGNDTEYEKRMVEMREDYMHPTFTAQSYHTGEQMRSACIMKTKDLYDFIDRHPQFVLDKHSDNTFKVVKWVDIQRCGYPIVWRGEIE
jgi:hypothetical protein